MNFILIIHGVMPTGQYQEIKEDLARQFIGKGLDVPFFVNLPSDYFDIEIVWLTKPEQVSDSVVNNFREMQMLAGE